MAEREREGSLMFRRRLLCGAERDEDVNDEPLVKCSGEFDRG
jgi:hypothetical protein